MAIDITSSVARDYLQRSLRESYEQAVVQRERRKTLIEIYRDRSGNPLLNDTSRRSNVLINTFQNFVRGQTVLLAFNAPKWQVAARVNKAKDIAFRGKALLNRLNEILGMQSLMERWALDTAFGRAVAKTCMGIAPKGIYCPYAPRTYRINPDYFITDPTASDIDECSYLADFYLVPMNEAQNYDSYDPMARMSLQEWHETGTQPMVPEGYDYDAFAEPMTRLIDVYIPSRGEIVTWPCQNDQFYDIVSSEPLMVRQTAVNPFSVCDMTLIPNELEDFPLLATLRPLHEFINDNLVKAARQNRESKRNPFAKMGTGEHDLDALLNKRDGEGLYLEYPAEAGLYTLPTADQGLFGAAQLGLSLFSQMGGNLEVALGQSAGADTARQTQALLAQLSSVQGVSRAKFERFLSDIGQKLLTLAFASETFALDLDVPVPGTTLSLNWGWAPPHLLPRVVAVDDVIVEVAAYSTSLRSPEQKIGQLMQANQIVLSNMMAAAQGAPINLQAVIADCADAFDQVVSLPEWWSGEQVQASPQQQASQMYSTMASQTPSERTVSYQSSGRGAPVAATANVPAQGGLQPLTSP